MAMVAVAIIMMMVVGIDADQIDSGIAHAPLGADAVDEVEHGR